MSLDEADEAATVRRRVPRTPEADAQIAAAREPPDAMELAMESELDAALEAKARDVRGDTDPTEDAARRVHAEQAQASVGVFQLDAGRPEPDPPTVLNGDDAATLDGFGQVCAALEEHAEKGQALQQAYRAALEQVSRMAARRNRGKR